MSLVGSNFTGEIMPEVVRPLAVIVRVLGGLWEFERELADLLSQDDVTAVADAMEPGSAPACWCAKAPGGAVPSAVRESGANSSRTGASRSKRLPR